MRKKTVTFLLAFAVAVLVLSGCNGPDKEASGGQVSVLVTRDFGRQEIYFGQVLVKTGESALEALQRQLEVQTTHGGRFVTAIEGLESAQTGGCRHDWFFYANGVTAAVGAGEYFPLEGDVIWWDYHPWGDNFFTPAVTGAFPQPFISGYRGNNPGTVILYTPPGREAAEKLRSFLKEEGAARVSLQPYGSYNLKSPREILLILALWTELAEEPFWQGVLDNREKAGWFARLSASCFISAGPGGEEKSYPPPVGALLASATGLGDPYPIWLLTALDRESLWELSVLLVKSPQRLRGTFGLLLKDGELVRLPH